MKKILYLIALILALSSCSGDGTTWSIVKEVKVHDTLIFHDTIIIRDTIAPIKGAFLYNLPCSLQYIHPELPNKAILVFWLHGGVGFSNDMDFSADHHHIDKFRNKAYNGIANYLQQNNIKAIYVAPVCRQAWKTHSVKWKDCEFDIKRIIDDYVNKGLVDAKRIYIAGSSDGATGTWDLVDAHPDWFAAAMAFSGGWPRMTIVPFYFNTAGHEQNWTQKCGQLNAQGANIIYEFFPNLTHCGGEFRTLMSDSEYYLPSFFSHSK